VTELKESAAKRVNELNAQLDSLNEKIVKLEADKEELKKSSSNQVAALVILK
jgi:TolA-binding protein